MIEVFVKLRKETPDSTIRYFSIVSDDKEVYSCYTLEDGKRDKKEPGKTRIPAGRYKLALRCWGGFYERLSNRFGVDHPMIEITGVPGFSDVLIHPGNFVADTRGCLLPGQTYWKDGTGNYVVGQSTAAYLVLYKLLACEIRSGKEVYLNIID